MATPERSQHPQNS